MKNEDDRSQEELLFKIEKLRTQLAETEERCQLHYEALLAEEQVTTILEIITDAFLMFDNMWKVIHMNQKAEQLLRINRDDLVGKVYWKVFPDTVDTIGYRELHRAMAEKVAVSYEQFYPPLNMWSEARGYPSKDGVYFFFMDITERKQMEDTLRKAHDELEMRVQERKLAEQEIQYLQRYNRGLIEVSLDPMVTFDQQGIIMDVNEAKIRATGKTREELIGTLFADYFTDSEKAYKGVMLVFETGEIHDYELVMVAKDGTETIVAYNASVYKDETGQVVGAFGVARDITEHKRTEKSVLESEEKFKAISSSANDAIIMMDNERNISYWNEAAEKIFGYSVQEALGKELHIFLASKKYYDSYRRGILIFKATGCGPVIGKTLELEAVRKDGTGFPIELSVSAVKIEEKWHAIGIVRDITQRKKAEEERETLIRELKDALAERKKAQQELEETIESLEVYTTRVNSLMVTMLEQATDKKTNVVILDISGVAVDVEISEPLVNIARLSRLLGATCIVTGIKSEAMRKLADLGITLAPITTEQSLKEGLRYTIAIVEENDDNGGGKDTLT